MRAFIASSIGVVCAAAAALPLSLPDDLTDSASAAPASAPVPVTAPRLPGSTQSLPLVPLEPTPTTPTATPTGSPGSDSSDTVSLGLPARDVEPFALLGVVWNDPEEELHGQVQVRTRSAADGDWTPWQDLEPHADAPDPASTERSGKGVRGGTAPLWVGDSDGVQVRAVPEKDEETGTVHELPEGLRLELVHPGDAPADDLTPQARASSEVNADLAPVGAHEIPAQDQEASETNPSAVRGGTETVEAKAVEDEAGAEEADTLAPIGPRPAIVTRRGWGADESIRGPFLYTNTVKVAFVHHTAMSNGYSCSQAPALIRGIYRYHVKSNGWRDVGYNFFVDKCGKIYEGRAGGVARPVMGAHTYGFNANSTGIAVLGSFNSTNPSSAAVNAVSKIVAWKLGLHGVNPRGTAVMTSGGGKYAKGTQVRFHTVAGHRDGYVTDCPGGRLYAKLGTIRETAARLQGR
ncbi:N-acetylmuramoyl-L-alanine amidase [Streptomyces sp. TRM43335]|uniref:N-acetylmuramoyl-L-alanine amidase n=1 Tax=Streptomyces taklimakanensis TaxID=2569853 RepID=A0A6G2BAL3_9ACTN|nr:N-acetylmuramoyl-L-alanine amidase [Streptomyces taklimakanensis]MTE19307.1 N-acetylmuramoyl-L-alanine amidase [Streptomyces taklimakanensis]